VTSDLTMVAAGDAVVRVVGVARTEALVGSTPAEGMKVVRIRDIKLLDRGREFVQPRILTERATGFFV
jgi:hypothetical protein